MIFSRKFFLFLIIFFNFEINIFADTPSYLDFKLILNESVAGKKAQDSLKKQLDSGIKSINSKEKNLLEEEKKLFNKKKLFRKRNILKK